MKKIHINQIINEVKEMCKEANYNLPEDLQIELEESVNKEESGLGKSILEYICTNAHIAREEQMPICQDTEAAVFFCETWTGSLYRRWFVK